MSKGRWIRCSCTSCDAMWRMTRRWINATSTLYCPLCREPAIVDQELTDEEKAAVHAAAEHSLGLTSVEALRVAQEARREEIRRHRRHARKNRGASTRKETRDGER